MAETDDIGKINYVFDAKKFNNRNRIMEQFQTMYQKNMDDVFEVIWNNQSLRSSLFDGNSVLSPKQQFNQLINNINSQLYKFISTQ